MKRWLALWLLVCFPALAQPYPTTPLGNATVAGTLAVSGTFSTKNPVADVVAFGADPTGATDTCTAFTNAAATGNAIYAPNGTYLLRCEVTLSNGQELYGDGRGLTTIQIDQTFSSTATGVISLTGREQFATSVRDLTINFAQPQDQTSRSNFKTLAAGCTSATGGSGCEYPPAIAITSANRFKLSNLRIAGAWDGIVNISPNTIGGFFIDNIEMGALDVGMSIDNVLDFSHVKAYHFWPFGLNGPGLYPAVYGDGNTFAGKFGLNGPSGFEALDFSTFRGRVLITNADSTMKWDNVNMDGNNASMEISGCLWCQMSNIYFTGSSTGGNTAPAQLSVTAAGILLINNLYSQSPSVEPAVSVTGGRVSIEQGNFITSGPGTSFVTQSGGTLEIRGSNFLANTGAGPWMTPLINVTGGVISFQDNMFPTSVGDVGGLVIAADNASNTVTGNGWNGWGWTPPGTLGFYGLNSDMKTPKTITVGSLNAINLAGATSVNLGTLGGDQRAVVYYTNGVLRWADIVNGTESGSNTGSNYAINEYDDTGAFLDTPFSINRASAQISFVNGAVTLTAANLILGSGTAAKLGGGGSLSGTFSGNPIFGGNITIAGATTLDSALGVIGATTLGTTLGVSGAATLSSTLGVTGATTLSSTLGVTGAATLSSTLGVTGVATLTGGTLSNSLLPIGTTLALGSSVATVINIGNSGSNTTIAGTLQMPSSTTGAGTSTFTNSPCTGLTTEQWVAIQITGQSGTWYVPACQ